MATRTLIQQKPERAKPGELVQLRAMIGHPMESGFRVGSDGKVVPRRILRRFTCHEGSAQIFAADLHPAVAANPYMAFHLLAPAASTTLTLRWTGDANFEHTETVTLTVA